MEAYFKMNLVYENIISRRSCRAFTDQEIKKEDLDLILKAGISAPSGMNRQSWQFTVIRKQDNIQRLEKVVRIAANRADNYNFFAPNVIVLVSNDPENVNGLADASCAMENMFLMAHSLGIASCWINQLRAICDVEEVRSLLDSYGIPSNHIVWGIADLGYAAGTTKEVLKKEDVIKFAD